MAKLNRRYIDKHWMVFMVRGVLAAAFGCYALFGGMNDITNAIAVVSVLLLLGALPTEFSLRPVGASVWRVGSAPGDSKGRPGLRTWLLVHL